MWAVSACRGADGTLEAVSRHARVDRPPGRRSGQPQPPSPSRLQHPEPRPGTSAGTGGRGVVVHHQATRSGSGTYRKRGRRDEVTPGFLDGAVLVARVELLEAGGARDWGTSARPSTTSPARITSVTRLIVAGGEQPLRRPRSSSSQGEGAGPIASTGPNAVRGPPAPAPPPQQGFREKAS